MSDVEIKFEREGLDGIIPVGTYVGDAMRRFGIQGVGPCDARGSLHECIVEIVRGDDLLSPLTSIESEYFEAEGLKSSQRLACQAKIERPGEIVVMTQEKKKEEEPKAEETTSDEYRKEFTELPLEKKIADLVRLEAITLGETFSFIFNSPMKVFAKVGDVMAEFGMKLETEAKRAQRPAEHANGAAPQDKSGSEPDENAQDTKEN
jgi:ferredoxin